MLESRWDEPDTEYKVQTDAFYEAMLNAIPLN